MFVGDYNFYSSPTLEKEAPKQLDSVDSKNLCPDNSLVDERSIVDFHRQFNPDQLICATNINGFRKQVKQYTQRDRVERFFSETPDILAKLKSYEEIIVTCFNPETSKVKVEDVHNVHTYYKMFKNAQPLFVDSSNILLAFKISREDLKGFFEEN